MENFKVMSHRSKVINLRDSVVRKQNSDCLKGCFYPCISSLCSMIHTFWHVVVHAPIEFSIGIGVCEDALVESLNSSHASLVVSDCCVDFAREFIPVLFILVGYLHVHSIDLLEPLYDLIFIVAEGESRIQ